jgi:hypothetical protein
MRMSLRSREDFFTNDEAANLVKLMIEDKQLARVGLIVNAG